MDAGWMKDAWKFVAGSMVTYAIVAACSAKGNGSAMRADSGRSGGQGGTIGVDSAADAVADALNDVADAVTDPVSDADAQPDEATVIISDCDQINGERIYASADFPGKSMVEIAGVLAFGEMTEGSSLRTFSPNGYDHVSNVPMFMQDGKVAVDCGTEDVPQYISVTFILP